MARLLVLRLATNQRRLSTAATAYAAEAFDELIRDEPSESKRGKLKYLQALWEELAKSREELVESRDDQARATEGQTRAREELARVSKFAIEMAQKTQTALTHELLRAKGLNDTRGLFDYLQDKILAKHPAIAGKRASETTWGLVLQFDPQLELCVRSHLPASTNPVTHLTEIYNVLSQHVHARKSLSQQATKIIFEGEFLSPQQCKSLTCLGRAVGIQVEPVPRKSIANNA